MCIRSFFRAGCVKRGTGEASGKSSGTESRMEEERKKYFSLDFLWQIKFIHIFIYSAAYLLFIFLTGVYVTGVGHYLAYMF